MPRDTNFNGTSAKRKRKAKSRTEVSDISSSSSSDAETKTTGSSSRSSESPAKSINSAASPKDHEMEEEVNEEAPHSPSEEPSPETESAAQPKQEDFSKFYLRQVTAALADDLDKVRSASDFSDAKVGMLIRALTQGETVFSDDEKRRIMGGTS